MLFSSDAHAGLAAGMITVTFRTWKRPQVKVGGRYRIGEVTLEVDRLTTVPVVGITDADARQAGFPDRTALLRRLGDPSAGSFVWRVDFHRVTGEIKAPPPLEDAEVLRRLERLDRARRDRLSLGAIAATRTMGGRCCRSGSRRRSGRRQR